MEKSVTISVVVPVYQGEASISRLHERLTKSLSDIVASYEIILVDDRSPDRTWKLIQGIASNDPNVRAFRLSRNFGQHKAITAGLDRTRGEWIVVMDCDLQDRPEDIPSLFAKVSEGYDIVLASRSSRKDTLLKRASSAAFYFLLGYLTQTKQDASVGNFGIYNKKVIHAVTGMRESIRYFPTMVQWVGFRSATIPVEHARRETGRSSYSLKRSLNLALNVVLAFSDRPLRLTIKLGFWLSTISTMVGIYYFFETLLGNIAVQGWPTIVISIWFLAGAIIFILGLVGLYVGKVFEQVKLRPIYIISENYNERESTLASNQT